jgi:hypothetical protein
MLLKRQIKKESPVEIVETLKDNKDPALATDMDEETGEETVEEESVNENETTKRGYKRIQIPPIWVKRWATRQWKRSQSQTMRQSSRCRGSQDTVT